MCDDRLPWPERAAFLRVVADGDYEVKNGAFVFVPGRRTSCGSVHLITLMKDANGIRINKRWSAPALKDSNLCFPSLRIRYSQKMLRALLPVHKNRILKGRSGFILLQLTALVSMISSFPGAWKPLRKPGKARSLKLSLTATS